MVFGITENLLHYSYAKTTEKEVFNGEKVSKIIFGKKGRTNAWWENFSNNKVPESDWKYNICMSGKSFYALCTKLRPCLQKKQTRLRSPNLVEDQVASFLCYISDEGRHRRTTNAF